jgi:ATP/ADP translocase
MAEYKKGSMDIHEQEASFSLFMGIAKWGSLIVATTLLFFIIWLCVNGAGIATAALIAVVVAIIGAVILSQ